MGSFGMDWNQKSSMLWDWENLAPFGTSANENPKNVLHPEPKGIGVGAVGNGSGHSSGGTVSCSSELGYGSSKSSISASIDSSKAGSRIEFNFAAVKRLDKDLGKNGELGRVEDTGTSPSSMMEVSRGEPLIGLKLGKRTYFEDVCGGNNVKSSPPSGSLAPSTALVKKARVSQQNTQNSYCQVEGCKVDLSTAKDYHRKHKVCEAHSKSSKVIIAGLERRFCQQCSRFHGLAEFDHKKRSCRRRLSDHNARRRKPQPETISFSSSRLSTLFYDARQEASLLFGQVPYGHGQMRSSASSSWDNSGGFKFTEAKVSWMKPTKAAGLDGLHFPSPEISNNVMAHHHDFDGLMPFKGTNAKVLNQGVEASAVASNSNGAPDLRRALSLLSTDSWGSADLQPSSHVHSGMTTLASASNPVMHALNSAPGFWQDEPPLDQHPRVQEFGHLGNGTPVHEFELPKPSYGNTSDYGQMH